MVLGGYHIKRDNGAPFSAVVDMGLSISTKYYTADVGDGLLARWFASVTWI